MIWFWLGLLVFALFFIWFALAAASVSKDADETAARMYADHCPDELESP